MLRLVPAFLVDILLATARGGETEGNRCGTVDIVPSSSTLWHIATA
jgi:hypothetical protein